MRATLNIDNALVERASKPTGINKKQRLSARDLKPDWSGE